MAHGNYWLCLGRPPQKYISSDQSSVIRIYFSVSLLWLLLRMLLFLDHPLQFPLICHFFSLPFILSVDNLWLFSLSIIQVKRQGFQSCLANGYQGTSKLLDLWHSAFSINFCSIRFDMSGNTVKKTGPKWTILRPFKMKCKSSGLGWPCWMRLFLWFFQHHVYRIEELLWRNIVVDIECK